MSLFRSRIDDDARAAHACGALTASYDEKYRTPNFFGDRRWLYRPFVRAVIRKAELRPGMRLLDAGCGQGFFTALFADEGIDSLGVDTSLVGIESARRAHRHPGLRFEVADVLQMTPTPFDCVFVRSFSPYNAADFATDTSTTDRLLAFVRPGGVLVFDYYTRLSADAQADAWRYHTLEAARKHFSRFARSEVYFSLRLDAAVLGRRSLSPFATRAARGISESFGLGGELLALVRRE